jgi:hypothetical protein
MAAITVAALARFAILCLLCLGACSPRHMSEAVTAGVDSSSTDISEYPDSILALESTLTPADIPEEAIAEMSHAESEQGPVARKNGRGRPRISTDILAVRGPRTDIGGRFRLGSLLSAGCRSDGRSTFGFLQLRPWWLIRNVVAGNMTLRMGERLVLGRGFIDYSMLTSPGVTGGVTAAPSLSRWFGRPGLAVELGTERWMAQAVLIGETTPRFEPAMLWLSTGCRLASTRFGVTVGTPSGQLPRDRAATVVSVHASHRGDGLELSAESAVWSRAHTYFAVRVSQRDSQRWSMRVYRAARFSADTNPATDPVPNGDVLHGAIADTGMHYRGVAFRITASLGSRDSASERRKFRRATVSAKRNRGTVRWEASIAVLGDTRTGSPGDLGETVQTTTDREIRFRGKAIVAPGPHLSHAVVVDYRPRRRWCADGLSIIVTARANLGRLQASGQVAAYSLGQGQGVFIARPGIGNFEGVSSIYGRGSDVALRLRLRLTRGLSLLGYYGEPWLKEHRTYLGVQFRFR